MQSKRRGKLLVFSSIALALLTALLLFSYLSSVQARLDRSREEPRSETLPVLMAVGDIPLGTTLTSDILSQSPFDVADIPIQYLPTSAVVVQPEPGEAIEGYQTRVLQDWTTTVDMKAGDILQATYLVQYLGILPGQRAFTIQLDEATNIRRGSRVDVIVSHRLEMEDEKIDTTMLLLQDLLVIDVLPHPTWGGTSSTPGEEEEEGGGIIDRVVPFGAEADKTYVTLAVRLDDSLRLTYMLNFASEVRLVLRRLDDRARPRMEPVTVESFR